MRNYILVFVFALFMSFQSFGQKFGHVNSKALLLEMPAVKSADDQLNNYQTTLVTKGQQMAKAFENEYNSLLEKANSNLLSPLQIQQEEAKLGQKQQEIQQYEQEVQELILQKREELYAPIFEQVDTAIKTVGKEGSYTMIFDTSLGAIVFVDESEDVTDKVKQKLNL